MSEQDDREAYNAELAVVRLAPVLERIMGTCRRDLHRQMDGIDYCETCPLLTHCHAQERRTPRLTGGEAALLPVRSETLLAEATSAIKALVEALECYTAVHGADEDDEQALELGRDVLRKANVSGEAQFARRAKEEK